MSKNFNTICIMGLGYIGLPTAAVFASRKISVVGVDINPHTVDTINRGQIHIVEPDLDMVVHSAVNEGYLRATQRPEPADAFLIAVPTPFKHNSAETPEPDLSYIEAAVRSIAPVLQKGNLIILESTSPVGTTEQIARWLADIRPDLTFPQIYGDHSDIRIAYCPERVLPGKIISELIQNDRVIGGLTSACSRQAEKLYKVFVKGECIITDARTAEMCKLTENSFRDANIAFANELSIICNKLSIDVWELIKLANRHPRVSILNPGPGVGGHCIAVDPWFIVNAAPKEAVLIRTSREVNTHKTAWVLHQIKSAVERSKSANGADRNPSIACFGLTFKPDIDDLRESPALEIVKTLCADYHGRIIVVEPNISALPNNCDRATLAGADAALAECDIVVFLVPHKPFKVMAKGDLQRKEIVDVCGILNG